MIRHPMATQPHTPAGREGDAGGRAVAALLRERAEQAFSEPTLDANAIDVHLEPTLADGAQGNLHLAGLTNRRHFARRG